MGLASDFGLLFILEAQDRASEIFDHVDESLARFGETARGAADTARGAGEAIDESLASTASGADALDLAAARTATAEERLAAAIDAQAKAEEALLAAREAAASQEELARAAENVAAAEEKATASAGELKAAQEAVAAAKAAGDEDALAAAVQRVSAAQAEAAATARALAGAQKEAAALVTADDIAKAADTLTASERAAKAASDDLTAAQARQADVQKAVAAADTEAAEAAAAEAAAQKRAAADADAAQAMLSKATKTAGLISLGMAVAGYESVKAAGNFQSATTHLVTDAGETAKNLQMVQAGILAVSTATGTSASAVTNAMYHIESAGYHGAAGLTMLKIAAQGAKVGNADLDTVSKTLVGVMNAYGLSASKSASMMNQLIATTAAGDMKMQDLASSLSSVAPLAAAAHVQFSQVGGAIATMTAQGMSADQATQDLSNTIRAMSNPNNVAIKEMQQLGIQSQDVSQHLGSRGLTGTIAMLTQAITSHMGKSGQVIMSAFQNSTTAAQDLQVMLKNMPPAFQSMAKGYLDGSVTAKQWRTELQAQTPINQHLMTQFAGLANKANSFNSLLTSGSPATQTYTAALAKMMGGATGLSTALMLSGGRMTVFRANADAIQAAADKSGKSVDNWGKIQSTFNFKLESAKTAAENTGIAIGSALLPAVSTLLQGITHVVVPIAEWTAKHRTLTAILFGSVSAIAATVAIVGVASKTYKAVTGTVKTMQAAYRGVMKLFGQAGEQQAAAAQKGAAAQSQAAAESEAASEEEAAAAQQSAAEQKAASGEAAAAAETDAAAAAAANETAAAESSGSWLASSASMIGSAARWVAQAAVKVAVVVAENVAGAAVTMAAWIAANAAMLLGVGLIVVAVVAAVALIVTHWKQISAFMAKLWHDIVSGAEQAWNWLVTVVRDVWQRILAFIKGWWPVLLAAVTGPLGLLVGLFVKFHTQIWDFIRSTWNNILGFLKGLWNDLVGFARSQWNMMVTVVRDALNGARAVVSTVWAWIKDYISLNVAIIRSVLNWFASLPGRFMSWLRGAANAVSSEGGRLLGWFRALPGRVWSALSGLGSMMMSVGRNLVIGIWNGLASMGSWLWSKISSWGNSILNSIESTFQIGSPSRKTFWHGQMLAQGLAGGLLAGTGTAVAAAGQMASRVLAASSGLGASGYQAGSLAGAAPGGPAAGGTVINLTVSGNHVTSDRDINLLVDKIGKKLATVTLPAAGRKVAY